MTFANLIQIENEKIFTIHEQYCINYHNIVYENFTTD